MFAVLCSSIRSIKSCPVAEASTSLKSSADEVSQELTSNSTPSLSDVETVPKKFLNRNPRYYNPFLFTNDKF